MGRGRPRKPSAIRELEGNRSRTAIPPDLPLDGVPECPERLNGEARRHFEFVAAELAACGVVKRLDTESLAMMASLWAAYWTCYDNLDIDGMCKLSAKWAALAGRYGLNPSDRAKLMATPAPETDETEDRFFNVVG